MYGDRSIIQLTLMQFFYRSVLLLDGRACTCKPDRLPVRRQGAQPDRALAASPPPTDKRSSAAGRGGRGCAGGAGTRAAAAGGPRPLARCAGAGAAEQLDGKRRQQGRSRTPGQGAACRFEAAPGGPLQLDCVVGALQVLGLFLCDQLLTVVCFTE